MMDLLAAGVPAGAMGAVGAAAADLTADTDSTAASSAGGLALEFDAQLQASLAENDDQDEDVATAVDIPPWPPFDLAAIDRSVAGATTGITGAAGAVDQVALATADTAGVPPPTSPEGAATAGLPVTASVDGDTPDVELDGHQPSATGTDQRAGHSVRKTAYDDALLGARDLSQPADISLGEPSTDAGATATTVTLPSEVSTGEMGAISSHHDVPATAIEAQARTGATVADASGEAFADLGGDSRNDFSRDDSSRGERTETPGIGGAAAGEAVEAFRAPGAGASELQAGAYEARVNGVTGLGSIALARLNDFETTHATFSTGAAMEPAPDTADRIVQSMRLQFQRGGGEATVHIKPDHLGPLTIALRVENGTVSAHVNAENPLVAEWLQANEHTLREGLKSNGLHLDRLVVHRDPDPHGRAPERDQSRREPRRRVNERHSTFEITV